VKVIQQPARPRTRTPHSPSTRHEGSSRSSKLKSIAARSLRAYTSPPPPSRARLRRLFRMFRPPLPPPRSKFVQDSLLSALSFPFSSSHLFLPLTIFHPPPRRRSPNLDTTQNNTLITAGPYPCKVDPHPSCPPPICPCFCQQISVHRLSSRLRHRHRPSPCCLHLRLQP
jgi:hypothetical protein